MSDKKVLITVGNVTIKEYDNMNVVVERYEEVFIPKTKEKIKKWVFKGYSRSVLSALLMIQRNELLIDRGSVTSLDDYVKQVNDSNNKLLEAVRE
ncbi:hypothetical protein ACFSTA_12395 [Ornithinibacillus salinisoli]|uniref:Uncharacterized protein n=1 Tax=Ornithinibacillus salinisoli TaxID=1848459 RepID=A0ABW4W2M3_9BACI